MSIEAFAIPGFFIGTILLVIASIEGGYRWGRVAHRRSRQEKESPISAIEGSVLALLAFILAFTFGIASNRFDFRKELVRTEANAIRAVWHQSDFLREPQRGETKALLREYVSARAAAVHSAEEERVERVIREAKRVQERLWSLAVAHALEDMSSDVAALYIQSLNETFALHASRVAVGFQMRIPFGIWLTLGVLTFLGMFMVGYQAGIVASKRTVAMPALAVAYAAVIVLIISLDHPISGFTFTTVSQQPMIDLLADIDSRLPAAPKPH
jgi:hypothetical protein